VIIPYHPGWGGSADDETISSMQDYVLHYLDLLDQMRLDRVRLVGLSMGGWMAATFAAQQAQRVEKLVLVAPAGLRVPQHPTIDIFRLRPEEIVAHLVANFEILRPYLPAPDDVDAIVRLHREQTSLARIAWERASDPKLARWLHRITMPTLLVWGEADRIVPFGQAQTWAELIPGARVQGFKNAGHLVLNEAQAAVTAIGDFLA
jgi:pimeloyl-ACP methyl ester carboxylesterase